MANCIPSVETADATSSAELRLYAALGAQLGDDYLVLHSIAWISRPKGQGPRDGEADFLICHPRRGLLVVEAKGGRIALDYTQRIWTSTDRNDVVHEIKNPFAQALRCKYGILEKLKETVRWQKLGIGRIAIGHAAFFPDIGDGKRLAGPDAPADIIGDRSDMDRLAGWVDAAFDYWAGEEPGDAPGARGVEAVRDLFARVATTRPLLSARLADEEAHRVTLTERQAVILNHLSRQRRVMIGGGAGTGKTLIAREKAVRAAQEGLRTLLVCYNRGLADHLREQCMEVANLEVASFHQLCKRWIDKARTEAGRDLVSEARRSCPGGSEFHQHQPLALANAIDLFGVQYDAVIVDEGQDFGDEYWMPVELLLSDPDAALLFVFLDENQDIYGRSTSIPIAGEPMVLDRNCRNTGRIHSAAYRYYKGSVVAASPIDGLAVGTLAAADTDKQARSIAELVTRLIAEEGVKPHEIGVLLCDATIREAGERALLRAPIPREAKWGRLEAYGPNSVTVDTVARFKGLERPVIILWGIDDCDPERDRERLYVGMSRAKSVLYLCGTAAACARAGGA